MRVSEERTEKPRVVIFRNHLLPWSETFVLDQGENLQEYKAFYLGVRRVAGLITPPDRTIVLRDGSAVGWMKAQSFRAFCWAPGLRQRLQQLGIRLIHAHFEGAGMSVLPLARLLGVPLVVTCHGVDVTRRPEYQWPNRIVRHIWLRRRSRLQSQGEVFLAVSSYIGDQMVRLGYPRERVVVHYSGVDLSSLAPSPLIGREPVVLFAGRLVEKKGCIFLVNAMQMVQRQQPGTRLVIIGDGPLRKSLEEQARAKGLNAEFLGRRTKSEVLDWMRRARVLSVPCLPDTTGDTDGCPTVFLEAQALGLPVVAFRNGGVPEAVAEGRTGRLVSVGDSRALADAILELCSSEDYWGRLSLEGRSWVKSKFDLHSQHRRLEDLYRRLIADSAAKLEQDPASTSTQTTVKA